MTTFDNLTVRLGVDDRQLRSGLQRAGRSTRQFQQSIGAVTTQFTVMAASVSAAVVAFDRYITAGGKAVTLQQGFTARVGDSAQALDGMKRATQGLVSEVELLTNFNKALQMGSVENAEQFEVLSEAALGLGRALGVDAAFALESLNVGIARQSRLILDNLGIMVSVRQANEKYAASVGKLASELTDAEKAEAFRTEALRQATEALDDLGGITLNAADAWQQLKVAIADAGDEMAATTARSETLFRVLAASANFVTRISGGDALSREELAEQANRIFTGPSGVRPGDALPEGDSFAAAMGQVVDSVDEAMAEMRAYSDEHEKTKAKLMEFENAMALATLRLSSFSQMDVTPRQLSQFELQTGRVDLTASQLRSPGMRFADRAPRSPFGDPAVQERLADATKDTADSMVMLTAGAEDAATGFEAFLDSFAQGTGLLDPTMFVSNLAANLGSMAVGAIVSPLIGKITEGISGIFGEDEVARQLREELEHNTRALKRNTDQMARVAGGTPVDLLEATANAVDAYINDFSMPDDERGQQGAIRATREFRDAMLAAGYTVEDARQVIEAMGLEWQLSRDAMEQYRQALDVDPFAGSAAQLDLAQTRASLLDLSPEETFNELLLRFTEQLGGGMNTFAITAGMQTPETFDNWLAGVLDRLEAGDLSAADLGGMTTDQFLDWLAAMEGAIDSTESLGDEMDRLSGVINAPQGFKVALERFNADAGELPEEIDLGGDAFGPILDGLAKAQSGVGDIESDAFGPVLDWLAKVEREMTDLSMPTFDTAMPGVDMSALTSYLGVLETGGNGGDVTIEQVTIQAAPGMDGAELYRMFQEELRLQIAKGGSDELVQAATERF